MIEFKNIKYNKEYVELIEAFIPNFKDKGLIANLELIENTLKININEYEEKVILENINSEKTKIKQGIYKIFSKYTNKTLKWGILVGVNPLKLFRKIISQKGIDKAKHYLKDIYYIDNSKIDLGFKVIENQKSEIKKLKGNSIYINIPFCPSKCKYCSYPTYLQDKEKMDEYVKNLKLEIKSFLENSNLKYSSLYIGGGTPSAIGKDKLDSIIKELVPILDNILEFTVELGRPETIDKELLSMLKNYGVNRISINPQSMNDCTLDLINRNHTVKGIEEKFYLARDLGFENINMDLIIGLPKESPDDFKNTLEKIKLLNPDSLSIHSLSLKKGSKLTSEGYSQTQETNFEKIRDEFVEKSGYMPYYLYRQKHMFLNIENIGFEKNNRKSIYNISMMEDLENIIGFGLGASTKFINNNKINRLMNYRTLNDYNKNINKQVNEKLLGVKNETKWFIKRYRDNRN